jgi:hypothetical protein
MQTPVWSGKKSLKCLVSGGFIFVAQSAKVIAQFPLVHAKENLLGLFHRGILLLLFLFAWPRRFGLTFPDQSPRAQRERFA